MCERPIEPTKRTGEAPRGRAPRMPACGQARSRLHASQVAPPRKIRTSSRRGLNGSPSSSSISQDSSGSAHTLLPPDARHRCNVRVQTRKRPRIDLLSDRRYRADRYARIPGIHDGARVLRELSASETRRRDRAAIALDRERGSPVASSSAKAALRWVMPPARMDRGTSYDCMPQWAVN